MLNVSLKLSFEMHRKEITVQAIGFHTLMTQLETGVAKGLILCFGFCLVFGVCKVG